MRCLNSINQQRGFTLMELLVAMGIFAIVVSVVYGAFRSTFNTVENAEYLMEISGKVQTFFDRIKEDLELVYKDDGSFFEGTEENVDGKRGARLFFVSSADLRLSREQKGGQLVQLGYFSQRNDNTGLLDIYRSEMSISSDKERDYEDYGLVLCKGVKAFRLTYFGSDENEYEEWKFGNLEDRFRPVEEGESGYPVLVRIELVFGSPDEEDDILFETSVSLNLQTGRDIVKESEKGSEQ